MENRALKKILGYLLLGIAVAAGGLFFSELCGDFFNGMEFGDAVTLGMGMYLCIVVVLCTGIILSRIDKK